jgi:hypothetical protein
VDKRTEHVKAWLQTFLARGPQWSTDVYDAGVEAGFSQDQIKRAKRGSGAEAKKSGCGSWFMRLKCHDGREPEAVPQESDQEG